MRLLRAYRVKDAKRPRLAGAARSIARTRARRGESLTRVFADTHGNMGNGMSGCPHCPCLPAEAMCSSDVQRRKFVKISQIFLCILYRIVLFAPYLSRQLCLFNLKSRIFCHLKTRQLCRCLHLKEGRRIKASIQMPLSTLPKASNY